MAMMKDGIWQLSREDTALHWLSIRPHLVAPCEMSSGRHTPEGLLRQIMDDVYSLFAAIVNGMIKSVAVVSVTDYSASRWLTIISCGGQEMVEWLQGGRQALEAFARHHDCTGIEVFGRKGWCRAMDLTPIGVLMERRL